MSAREQADAWSHVAEDYEKEFVDPYAAGAENPLLEQLEQVAGRDKVVADLGCGIGPLLPFLSARFQKVWAVDFAEGMLKRAKKACKGLSNVEFLKCALTEPAPLSEPIDVAVAVNSLVLPDPVELQQCLSAIHGLLKPGGVLVGIVPAMDAVHYHVMLLLERALERGMPLDAAKKNAASHSEHAKYDTSFGEFRYRGLVQHFWQPFEVEHRLTKAGFVRPRLKKVLLPWSQFPLGPELKEHPQPWDWFFCAKKSKSKGR